MFIPKTQKWEVKEGDKVCRISLSVPAFFGGKMKFKIDEKEYVLKPLKAISYGFKRNESFNLGESKGMLQIAANGDAQLFLNGKEVAQKV